MARFQGLRADDYFASVGRPDLGLIGTGIAVNCIPVIGCGLHTILCKPQDLRLGTIWNRDARSALIRENPHMLAETLILCGAALLPFVLAVAALYGLLGRRGRI